MIIENWDMSAAWGIINMDVIKFIEENKITEKELSRIGRNFISLGHEIWVQRCKDNQIKQQKSIPHSQIGSKEFFTKINKEEILKKSD